MAAIAATANNERTRGFNMVMFLSLIGRRLTGERDGSCPRYASDSCFVAHIQFHLALEFHFALNYGSGPNDDHGILAVEHDAVRLLDEDSALDMRCAHDADIAVDGTDTSRHMRR